MQGNGLNTVVRDVQTLFEAGTFVGLSDGQLLDRFVTRQEGASLEALVLRHGSMVWGVCRRVLRDHHDAEDAFQATFLVLARKAASIVPREKVGNWLYGVAYQTAQKARATRARRQLREVQVPEAPEPESVSHVPRDDLADLLDHELSRLPEKYRTPIVLCELEGKTHGEAAERLGWPVGTVSGRLSRARAILAKRLTRRGVSHAGGALAVLLIRVQGTAWASVPTELFLSTVKAASLFAARRATTVGLVPVKVAALAREVLKSMLFFKIKVTTAALMVIALAGTGLWQATTQADERTPADERFRVIVNEVIHDESIVVTQIGIQAPPGSKLELTSDKRRGNSVLSTDVSNPPDGSSAVQLVYLADQFEGKRGEPSMVKFMFGYKLGGISSSTSSSAVIPADANSVSSLLSARIKSGEYKFGQAVKLVTFQSETYTLTVNRPK